MRIELSSKNYAVLDYYDQQKRDILLILPGGGYSHASVREGKPVADAFTNLRLHTVVYHYRETLLTYPSINEEAIELLNILKKDALIQHIHIIGFSAGGHFALMLLEKYSEYFKSGILCYPVVSVHQKLYHGESFRRLMGDNKDQSLLEELSLEMHVHDRMPPIFIFHTVDDSVVPIGNSLVLIDALKAHHITVEAHLFPHGRHGVSIATAEVAFIDDSVENFMIHHAYLHEWVDLAKTFLERHML